MSTLADRVRRAAEFANVDGNGHDFERGRQRAHLNLKPLIEALAECADLVEKYNSLYGSTATLDTQKKLEAVLAEMEKP